jgi:hypothetical protein
VQGTLQKLASWLVLVACVISGVSPAQQLVVCLEPDGSVVLEAAAPAGCTPCGQEDSSREAEQLAAYCCPCIDIPLPTQGEERQARPKASEGHAVAAAVLPPSCIATIVEAEPARLERSAHAEPRPPPALALIRTVVLRV